MIYIICLVVASSMISQNLISVKLKFFEFSLYRFGVLILFIITILLFINGKLKIKKKIYYLHQKILVFYLFWFIVAFASYLWSYNDRGWFQAMFYLGYGFSVIFSLSYLITEKHHINVIFSTITIMATIHIIIGMIEIITGRYYFADLSKIDQYNQYALNPSSRIPISMFANQNDYATFLSTTFFIILFNLKNKKNSKVQKITWVILLSSVYLIYRSGSRANIIAVLLGSLTYILVLLKNTDLKRKILLLFIIVIGFKKMLELQSAKSILEFNTKIYGSDKVRMNLIFNGLIFLIQTFGFGVGAGNTEYWMEFKSVFDTFGVYPIHNWWFEILTGYGIIIFILYSFLFVRILVFFKRNIKTPKDAYFEGVSLVLISTLISFIFASVSSSSIMGSTWLWTLWAIVISIIKYMELNYNENIQNTN